MKQLALVTLLLCAPLAAQRERVLGRTLLESGEPWPHAEVVLFARPFPELLEVGRPDQVRVKSDERGRFRAELRPGYIYSAWAIGTTDEDRTLSSHIVEGVAVGAPLRLVQDPRPRIPTRIHLRRKGGGDGKLRVRVLLTARNVMALDIELDDRLEAVLPVLPGERAFAEVQDAEGRPLAVRAFPLASERIVEAAEEPRGFLGDLLRAFEKQTAKEEAVRTRRLTVVLPARSSQRAVVRDRKTKKPIAGARIRGLVSYSLSGSPWSQEGGARRAWVPVGTSGADGTCELSVPASVLYGDHPWGGDPVLKVTAPGYAAAMVEVAGLGGSKGSGLAALLGAADREQPVELLELTLGPGARASGRILRAEDEPAAGLPLVVTSQTQGMQEGFAPVLMRHPVCRRVIRTDQEGRFEVPDLAPGLPFVVHVGADDARFDASASESGPPAQKVLIARGKAPVALAPARLDALFRLDLELVGSDGSPARDARILLMPEIEAAEHFFFMHSPAPLTAISTEVRSDRRGLASMLVAPGQYSIFAYTSGHEYFLGKPELRGPSTKKRLDLVPMAVVAGRVLDQNGGPLPGAQLSVTSSSISGDAGPLGSLLYAMNDDWLSGTTDANGAFRLHFIPMKGFEYEVQISHGSWSEEWVEAEEGIQVATESLKNLELRLDVDRKKQEDK